MNTKQKRSLILASIIGTLFNCYDDDEKTKLHNELHSRIGKGIRKQVKLYGTKCITQVSHDEGQSIWKSAVDHFAEQKITIEASSCILSLVNLDEKSLSKHYGLSAGKLGQWAKPSRRNDRIELEKNSNAVAKFVFNAVNELYGIEEERKLSILERLNFMKKESHV